MAAAQDLPALDLWVLVASRPIDSQLTQALARAAATLGIEFQAIETGDGVPSTLAALFAHAPAIVRRHLARVARPEAIVEIDRSLDHAASSPGFNTAVEGLRKRFLSASIGYPSWRLKQNQDLLTASVSV